MEARTLFRHRQTGLLTDNTILADTLIQLGNFREQLAQYGGQEEALKGLIEDYLPLIDGGGELEAFLLPPCRYNQDNSHLGLGVGLRRPITSSPLEPTTVPSLYGDLLKIEPFIKRDLDDWQKHGIVTISSESYMLLGPLQLVHGYHCQFKHSLIQFTYRLTKFKHS